MTDILDTVQSWFSLLPPFSVTNILEIIIIAIFVYEGLVWIKTTKAWILLRGIIVIILFTAVAAFLQLTTIMWLIEKASTAAIIGAVVIFQPELRKALEQLGSRNFIADILPLDEQNSSAVGSVANELIKATFEMAKKKTGALIVIQQTQSLKDIEATGIQINGIVTSQLLINIFEKNTPLHDGAVVIVGDKVTAATCYLPLSDSTGISKDFGTRHRAALGISESTDSITIVVSEETGRVSIAEKGELIRINDAETLRFYLPSSDRNRRENRKKFQLFKKGRKEHS